MKGIFSLAAPPKTKETLEDGTMCSALWKKLTFDYSQRPVGYSVAEPVAK